MPTVSVILPTHNRPGLLYRALRSIEDQTFDDFEAVVVNDAGEDVRDIVAQFPFARYVAHKENRGLSAARNTGIRASSGRYIAYLDDDDIYYSDHLETLVEALENGAMTAYSDADRMLPGGRRVLFWSRDYDPVAIRHLNVTPVNCVMHHRDCLDVGMFDEDLSGHEDWDLWIRMFEKYPPAHVKKVTCAVSFEDGETMSGDLEAHMRTYHQVRERYAQAA